MGWNVLALSFSPAEIAVICVVTVLLVALTVLNVLFIVYLKKNVERRLAGGLQEERDKLLKQLKGMNAGELPEGQEGEEKEELPPPPHKLQDEKLQSEREFMLDRMSKLKERSRKQEKQD